MKCSKCLEEIPAGAKHCPHCGRALRNGNWSIKEINLNVWLGIVFALALVITFIVAMIYRFEFGEFYLVLYGVGGGLALITLVIFVIRNTFGGD